MKVIKYILTIFLLIATVSFSDTIHSVEERGDGSTYYYVFEDFKFIDQVTSDLGLAVYRNTRNPLIIDYDQGVTNWTVDSSLSQTYEGQVVGNILPNGSANMARREVRVQIEYYNNNAMNLVSYDDLETTKSIAISHWLFNEVHRTDKFNERSDYAKASSSMHLSSVIMDAFEYQYIQGPLEKEVTQVNTSYYGTHQEVYGSFIIDITTSGSWEGHEEVATAMNALVIAARAEADIGLERVGFYETMFLQEEQEVEEEVTELNKITGTLKFIEKFEVLSENTDSGNSQKTMDYASTLMEKPCENQMIFLSIHDNEGYEIASLGPVLTNKKGYFEFEYPYTLDEEYNIMIITPLVHLKSSSVDSQSFAIMDRKNCGATNNYVYLKLTDERVSEKEDLLLEDIYLFDLDSPVFLNGAASGPDYVAGYIYAAVYSLVESIEDFYTETIGYELPAGKENMLSIYVNTSDVIENNYAGNYDHLANYINVADYFTTDDGLGFVHSVISHEFSHKIMYDLYGGKYPLASASDWLIGTYGNTSTAHSLTEGYAYFMQHVVVEHYGGSGTFPSPIYGNLEPDYPAWLNSGLHEARAVAGVLYDLYDGGEKSSLDDDRVFIPIKSLLDLILSQPLDSFAEFYEKLIKAYPSQKEAINNIVVAHGLFSVNQSNLEGMGQYHQGEGFIDRNRNYKYDQGEIVINYNALDDDGHRYQAFSQDSKIGYASYAANKKRQMQAYDPAFRIKTNSNFKSYTMAITFSDKAYLNYSSPVTAFNGYINLPIIPYNHEATIKIYPTGLEDRTEAFSITTAYLFDHYDDIRNQGYIDQWLIDLDNSMQQLSDLINEMPIMVSQALLEKEKDDKLSGEQRLLLYKDSGFIMGLNQYNLSETYPEFIIFIEEPVKEQDPISSPESEDEPLDVSIKEAPSHEEINIPVILMAALLMIFMLFLGLFLIKKLSKK